MLPPQRVLVVDDSGFFRRRIIELLESDPRLKVVDSASNGQEAVDKAASLRPDVITMDIEMPVMDGITAVRRIMDRHPTPILMFSSLTHEGARSTLDALEAGAMDFLPKSLEDISRNRDELKMLLCRRVLSLARRGRARVADPVPVAATAGARAPAPRPRPAASAARAQRPKSMDLVAIGASTGGPVALQSVLTALPANFRWPLLLIQHMPATFTGAFAERLNQQCAIRIREAVNGDVLEPGLALLAPGGKQMRLDRRGGRVQIRVEESAPQQHYRPSVDVTLEAVAQEYAGRCLAIVLTGMGADGREGARELKRLGATVWVQDEATSVIYGMPGAIAEAGLADAILPLQQIGPALGQGT